jgi:DNA polymerase III delta subunit
MAIFCFVGQSKFLLEEKIKELKKDKISLSFNKDFKQFFLDLQRLSNRSIFEEKKVIVIYNLDKLVISRSFNDPEVLDFVYFLKNNYLKNDFILVFQEKPIEFFDFLHKNKIKFEIIDGSLPNKNLEKFIIDYFKKYNLKVSSTIINFLKENYSNDPELLFRDLQKIVALKEINSSEIIQILHLNVNIFKIQDYLLAKNWPLFIHHFKRFIFKDKSYNKTETLKALSLFFHSLVKIYLLKTGKTSKLKGNRYYLYQLKEKSENLTIEEIKKLINALAKSERKLKKFYLDIKELPEDISLNYLFS